MTDNIEDMVTEPIRVAPVVLLIFSLVMVVVAHLLPHRNRKVKVAEDSNKMA